MQIKMNFPGDPTASFKDRQPDADGNVLVGIDELALAQEHGFKIVEYVEQDAGADPALSDEQPKRPRRPRVE